MNLRRFFLEDEETPRHYAKWIVLDALAVVASFVLVLVLLGQGRVVVAFVFIGAAVLFSLMVVLGIARYRDLSRQPREPDSS